MPWARSSLGTIEYLEDLWQQENMLAVDATEFSQRSQFSAGTMAERAYLDRFHSTVSSEDKSRGVRYIPRQSVLEMSEVLPTSASMGHHMMTAGLKPRQFFWCELCSA